MKKSRFIEFLIRHNELDQSGFEEWVFYPGMLFHSQDKWWEDGGVRQRPHEGVDFCFYRDAAGQFHNLDKKTKIPVMYDGEIVNIQDDFLGKSLFLRHDISDNYGNRLYTMYGHTSPYRGAEVGRIFREGETIAAIADAERKNTQIASHLHISVAWLQKSFPHERLDWKTINDDRVVTLCDPLEFIERKYKVRRGVLWKKSGG
ncbi:MAG: M23 family metallopeptidase [Candidatus Brocadia sp.]|uniref:M23ase beta-sheet core domain-containing protein n=1 Tax=Candidatus Brocadia fulgida TaxID=380242 RepID=A0A0M2UX15_9BACT|nr:MAG: hypothetical protein BROFUL_00873 [Candidatus Brocadia fulgida]UJS20568.1 MAG: M23 family metallopeptidase [Candidatus Brocadia sp.]